MTGGTICISVVLTLGLVSLLINRRGHTNKRLPLLTTFSQSDNAEDSSELTPQRIVDILDSKGMKPSLNGHWIIFVSQEDEYAINTSGYPVLSLLKQTDLDGFPIEASLHEKVASRITGEILMTKIHIKDYPSRRVIFQLDAIEDNTFNFGKRLEIYLEIIKEAEERFFREVTAKKNNNIAGYQS